MTEEPRCEICGEKITSENIGLYEHNKDGTKTIRCKECHAPIKKRRKSSYGRISQK